MTQTQGGDVRAFLEEQKQVGRDNARTPFQWDDTACAGFTTGKSWLKIHPDYRKVNVKVQEQDPKSVLHYFRKAVDYRKAHMDLIYGDYRLIEAEHEQVYAYWREGEEQRFLILLNFSPEPAVVRLEEEWREGKMVLNNYEEEGEEKENGYLTLRPFEAMVWEG